jgi:hypothetical protein
MNSQRAYSWPPDEIPDLPRFGEVGIDAAIEAAAVAPRQAVLVALVELGPGRVCPDRVGPTLAISLRGGSRERLRAEESPASVSPVR